MTWVIKSYTIKKNHEIQFLTNQILNDKIKKKKKNNYKNEKKNSS